MDRVEDTAERVLGVPLPESLLVPRTTAGVSARSWCGASLWTYVADRYVISAM